jgi:CBS domain-containing protein
MIGGVSQLSEPPRRVKDEAVMALVGPLVSLALGAALYVLHLVVPSTSFGVRFALFYLGSLNVMLGLFNLLPAFPMDGGRVLRSALTRRKGLVGATRIAANVGKAFAVIFGVLGFLSFNVFLLLIAFVVFVGADSETRAVLVKAAIGRLRVSDLMSSEVSEVPSTLSVEDAANQMLRERRLAFVVTANQAPVGVVTLDAVKAVPSERRAHTQLSAVMSPATILAPEEEAGQALRLMAANESPQLVVAESGRVVGTIGRQDIIRALKLSELEESQRQVPTWPRLQREAPA